MLIMGGLGYLMRKFHFEPTPFIFAFILGPMFEEKFRQSLLYSSGSFLVFIQRPISAAFVVAAFLLLVSPLTGFLLRRKEVQLAEEKKASSLPRRYDLWSGTVLLALALGYMWEAGKLGIGTPRTPAPGFFPSILGGALVLLCLIEVYAAFVQERQTNPFQVACGTASGGEDDAHSWLRRQPISSCSNPSATCSQPLCSWPFSSRESNLRSGGWLSPGAVLSSAVTYILFRILLQVQLPRGIFSFG